MAVAPDGRLSEPNPVVTFSASDVPAAARLQGVAVVAQSVSRRGLPRDRRREHRDGDTGLAVAVQSPHSLFGKTRIDGRDVDPGSARSTLL